MLTSVSKALRERIRDICTGNDQQRIDANKFLKPYSIFCRDGNTGTNFGSILFRCRGAESNAFPKARPTRRPNALGMSIGRFQQLITFLPTEPLNALLAQDAITNFELSAPLGRPFAKRYGFPYDQRQRRQRLAYCAILFAFHPGSFGGAQPKQMQLLKLKSD